MQYWRHLILTPPQKPVEGQKDGSEEKKTERNVLKRVGEKEKRGKCEEN